MAKNRKDLKILLADSDGLRNIFQQQQEDKLEVEVPEENQANLVETPEAIATSVINESEYLQSADLHLPFSTALRADLYLKLKRVEYWDRTSIKKILEKTLEEYLNSKPSSRKALPLDERNKLKQLKTAKDYIKLKIESGGKNTNNK